LLAIGPEVAWRLEPVDLFARHFDREWVESSTPRAVLVHGDQIAGVERRRREGGMARPIAPECMHVELQRSLLAIRNGADVPLPAMPPCDCSILAEAGRQESRVVPCRRHAGPHGQLLVPILHGVGNGVERLGPEEGLNGREDEQGNGKLMRLRALQSTGEEGETEGERSVRMRRESGELSCNHLPPPPVCQCVV